MTGNEAPEPFASFEALHAAHAALLKNARGQDELAKTEIRDFLGRARETGRLIDTLDERWEAQSILDYWGTTLDRRDGYSPDVTLREFDPSLAPELPDDACPYLGLRAFGPEQKDFFFGRDGFVRRLVEIAEKSRFIAIVGPSGSGKSSVAVAGLVPALQERGTPEDEAYRRVVRLVPGASPLEALARAILVALDGIELRRDDLRGRSAVRDLLAETVSDAIVLVVDQFEELFTLCQDEAERTAFLGALYQIVEMSGPRHLVIVTMRSDFEPYVAREQRLESYFEKGKASIPALKAQELRDAIQKPADRVGLKFESGLVDQLVHDILGEPAALPLLQFTLLKLWDARERDKVTWSAYHRLGGGRTALARSADAFYEGEIPQAQAAIKVILLRLVRPGEGLEVTSNRVERERLFEGGFARATMEGALDRLVAEHLVRITPGEAADGSKDRVEVAHEALIRNWPTLAGWLDTQRTNMRHRAQLTSAARRWSESGRRRRDLLLRGLPLEEAKQWQKELNDEEQAFVRASVRDSQRRVRLFSTLAVAVIIALGTLAWLNWERAQSLAQLSEERTVQRDSLQAQRDSLQAQRDSLQAQGDVLQAQGDVLEAQRDSLRAQRDSLGAQQILLRGALTQARTAGDSIQDLLRDRNAAIESRDSALIREARVATAETLARMALATEDEDRAWLLALLAIHESPDETPTRAASLAAALAAARALVERRPHLVTDLPPSPDASGEVFTTVAVDRTGTYAAASTREGSVSLWRLPPRDLGAPPRLLQRRGPAPGLAIHTISVATAGPSRVAIATAGTGGSGRVWLVNADTGADAADPVVLLSGQGGDIVASTFDAQGRRLVTAGTDGLTVWNASTGDVAARHEWPDMIVGVDLSANGEQLVAIPYEGVPLLLDWRLPRSEFRAAAGDGVPASRSVAAHPDSTGVFVVGGSYGDVAEWTFPTMESLVQGTRERVVGVGYLDDGWIAAYAGGVVVREDGSLMSTEADLTGFAAVGSGPWFVTSAGLAGVSLWSSAADPDQPDELIRLGCLRLGREPTPDERAALSDLLKENLRGAADEVHIEPNPGWICE